MANTSDHLTPAGEDADNKSASDTSVSVSQERVPEDAASKSESRTGPSAESITGHQGAEDLLTESGLMLPHDAEPHSSEEGQPDQVATEGQGNYENVEAKVAAAARECLDNQNSEEKNSVVAVAKLYEAVSELLVSPALLDAFSKKHPKVKVGHQSDNPFHRIAKASLGEDRKFASKISRYAAAAWGLHLAHVSATKQAVIAWCGEGGIKQAQKIAAARRKELRAERRTTPVEANGPMGTADNEVPIAGFGPEVAKQRNLTQPQLVGVFEKDKDCGYGLVKLLDDPKSSLGFGPSVAEEHNLTQPEVVGLFAREVDGGYTFIKWVDDPERSSDV